MSIACAGQIIQQAALDLATNALGPPKCYVNMRCLARVNVSTAASLPILASNLPQSAPIVLQNDISGHHLICTA